MDWGSPEDSGRAGIFRFTPVHDQSAQRGGHRRVAKLHADGGVCRLPWIRAGQLRDSADATEQGDTAQTAGNLNVVVVGWNDSTPQINSVTDSKGNAYVLAVGPTVQSGTATQAIYYAKNIAVAAATGNTVTVTFNTGAASPDVRIAEYSGIDLTTSVDVVAAAQGSSASSTSGSERWSLSCSRRLWMET
jgi:hypothetical protein